MNRYLLIAILTGLAAANTAYAFDLKGSQPVAPYGVFSTFSAEGLPKGASAISFGVEKSRQPDFYRFTAQLGHGITDAVEIGATVPYVLEWQDSVDGVEDITVYLKHRFFDEGRYGPSVAYVITAGIPSGRDDFSTEGGVGAGIVVSKKVGPVYGHANLFYSRPGTDSLKDDITFSAGIDFSASHSFRILGELYGKKSYSGKLDRLEARFGYRIITTENLFTTIGAGFDLKNRSPEYRLLFSLTYHLPREKRRIRDIIED